MIDMARKDILPAAASYIKDLSQTAQLAETFGADNSFERDMIQRISAFASETYRKLGVLEKELEECRGITDLETQARCFHDRVFTAMSDLRTSADGIEALVGEKYWPYPTYGALLFYVM